jgi:hypothetical protein
MLRQSNTQHAPKSSAGAGVIFRDQDQGLVAHVPSEIVHWCDDIREDIRSRCPEPTVEVSTFVHALAGLREDAVRGCLSFIGLPPRHFNQLLLTEELELQWAAQSCGRIRTYSAVDESDVAFCSRSRSSRIRSVFLRIAEMF